MFESPSEVSAWMLAGERQSAKLRTLYLQALLRQDISYFDTESGTGDFVSSISSNPLTVQDAISEKVCSDTLLKSRSELR
jgi:ATP-binding cassette subfamily B (MDR/TAP) protein 1